jgi:hypothetical protein
LFVGQRGNCCSVTDRDVTDKIDLDYIRSFAEGKPEFEHTALVYICQSKTLFQWKKDHWKSKGSKYNVIVLPHDQILALTKEEVRALMLSEALKRQQRATS